MKQKRILLGVTGSIAAYKAVEVARSLVKSGYIVDVILTESALSFVGPLTFAALINGDLFSPSSETSFPFAHLELAKRSDLILICPATASTINKIANGVADNLLTTVVLAAEKPGIICPAMNVNMYHSEMVQNSLKRLESLGWTVVEPEKGELACGDVGAGRLAPVEKIVEVALLELDLIENLKGKKILITSGPTREWIDDVRFISNASSGKMGSYLALEAKKRGAEVTFITGPAKYVFSHADKLIFVETASEMLEKVEEEFDSCDALIMAAAVSDFGVKKVHGKLKKENINELKLSLKKNPDILKKVASKKEGKVVVGFSLESENLEENARKKLIEKNLDVVVANPVEAMESDYISAMILTKGEKKVFERISKRTLAIEIITIVSKFLNK